MSPTTAPGSTRRRNDAIIIVGAGIFGLSTALHLARRGYTDVTVFDKKDYDSGLYSYFRGCDGASSDINKIVRSGYGNVTVYQDLTLEAIDIWNEWNAELASGRTVPPGMSTADRVWINNGHLSLTDGPALPQFEIDSIRNIEAAGAGAGLLGTQFRTSSAEDVRAATGMGFNMEPFKRQDPGRPNLGVMDTTGGTAFADKACRFALHKARSLGARFVFGDAAGCLAELLYDHEGEDEGGGEGEGESKRKVVTGIRTADGETHRAAMTILACGGWTPALLPALDGLCEATGGSVALFRLGRGTPEFERFAPERFPSWAYKMRDGAEGGLYGLPRSDDGWLKIGYRGTKYTNPVVITQRGGGGGGDGRERSVPITRWNRGPLSGDGKAEEVQAPLRAIPEKAVEVIGRFVHDFLPELEDQYRSGNVTRVCWYTDSFDNHLVVDRVPDAEGLMVATGGSGHAFKYLPAVGDWVVDILEGSVGQARQEAAACWKWRKLQDGDSPFNVLMEGSAGSRALQNVVLGPETEDPTS